MSRYNRHDGWIDEDMIDEDEGMIGTCVYLLLLFIILVVLPMCIGNPSVLDSIHNVLQDGWTSSYEIENE